MIDPEMIEEQLVKLSDPNPDVRGSALVFLTSYGPEAASVPVLMRLAYRVKDEAEGVRMLAVDALASVGMTHGLAVAALQEATRDRSPHVQRRARGKLAALARYA